MAKSAGRKNIFILTLFVFLLAGVAFLMFRDIPVQQVEKSVQINHAELSN